MKLSGEKAPNQSAELPCKGRKQIAGHSIVKHLVPGKGRESPSFTIRDIQYSTVVSRSQLSPGYRLSLVTTSWQIIESSFVTQSEV